jgi:hypothetical protein
VSIDSIKSKKNEKEIVGVACPLIFNPYMSNCLPDGLKIDYLGSAFEKEIYHNESSKKEKRRILITQNHVSAVDTVGDRIRAAGQGAGAADLYGLPEPDEGLCGARGHRDSDPKRFHRHE